ncbi:MAG TPA: hypothetical protein VNP91_01030 [Methylomirabilota bacterium]|nr:hypothetical protein [Methylomirabilota bacterium]
MTRTPLAFAIALIVVLPMVAVADHGGPSAPAPMSPLVLALLAGGLTLLAGILLVVIITRRRGPAEEDE